MYKNPCYRFCLYFSLFFALEHLALGLLERGGEVEEGADVLAIGGLESGWEKEPMSSR